jgi:hypothetical protein
VKAYQNNKLKLNLLVSGSKILNVTNSIRLSDSAVGAKFMGVSSKYEVYLYEVDGTIYKFTSTSWYSPSKVTISGKITGTVEDENGFLTAIKTSKGTYKLSSLDNSKWKAKKTYAVRKSNYATMYKKGSTSSYTLKLSKSTLTLNGKKVTDKVKYFGFLSASKIVLIKTNGLRYTATISKPTKLTLVDKNKTKSFVYNTTNGLVKSAKLANGKIVAMK